MKQRIIVFALLCLIVVVLYCILEAILPPHVRESSGWQSATKHFTSNGATVLSKSATAQAVKSSPTNPSIPNQIPQKTSANPSTPVAAALASIAAEPEFTKLPPATVLENMRLAFRNYLSMFRENPVGTNPEITQALDGGNRKQTHFVNEEDGLRINQRGELIDPWGTPYFFHQLSGTEMEIHSAGPDRVMWTQDDLVSR